MQFARPAATVAYFGDVSVRTIESSLASEVAHTLSTSCAAAAEEYVEDTDDRASFLESVGNLRPLVRTLTGRQPSVGLTREIIACLQQGRYYYEAAARSPLQIRPLLLYYGMIGFAKGLDAAVHLRRLATFPHAHGLVDVSEPGCKLRDLRVRIDEFGTFQNFNDTVAPLNRVVYYGRHSLRVPITVPSATSAALKGVSVSLKDVLARIPGLESLYRSTFGDEASTTSIQLFHGKDKDHVELTLWHRDLYSDRYSLREMVARWRDRYPCLLRWRFVEAQLAYDKSAIKLENVDNTAGEEEFSDENVAQVDRFFYAKGRSETAARLPLESILQGCSGNVSATLVAPLDGLYVSEFSLHYMALFLLASLVRYRPDIWGHALSRMSTDTRPADDEILALLNRFLEINQGAIPLLVVRLFNPDEER